MNTDRDARLAAFDAAHAEFVVALQQTPAAALPYRPAGEDYALGGLAVHVALVLEQYARVLDVMRAADGGPVTEPPSAPSESDAATIRDGFDEGTLAVVLMRVRDAHTSMVSAVRDEADDGFRRTTPVTYAGGREPVATSPADVLGWVHDHYTEHVRQVGDLRRQASSG